jgi:hypothetical protein
VNLAILERFTKMELVDTIGLRKKIAARMIASGKYVV